MVLEMMKMQEAASLGGDANRLKETTMAATEQTLIEKIKQLPPQRLAEVEDFIDFLRTREDEQRLTQAAAKASESSFAAVWDNDEDAAYDRL
jgi:hypothetical protein